MFNLFDDNQDEIANTAYKFDLLGQRYAAENSDTAALECYERATSMYPDCSSAWHNMGLLHMKFAQDSLESDLKNSANFFNTAQVFIKKALDMCNDNPVFLQSIASWHEQYVELLELAIEDEDTVQENIAKNFGDAIHYYQNAFFYCKEEELTLKNIILSNLTECLAQYGHHLYKNENYQKAQEIYLKALNFDPEHLVVINQIGMSLVKQTCFRDARQYFASILEKTEDLQEIADAWLNIACTYRLEKKWQKAEEALGKAKQFAPEDSSIADEEMKLNEAKSAATLVAAPQTLFSHSTNADLQHSEHKIDDVSGLEFR